jgi:hypothetical protein
VRLFAGGTVTYLPLTVFLSRVDRTCRSARLRCSPSF